MTGGVTTKSPFLDDLLQIIRDAKGRKWITGREPHDNDSCVRLSQADLELIESALMVRRSLWRRLIRAIWK
jgi:hypothetical protein